MSFQNFTDNIKSIVTGDYEEGRVDLNTLSDPALIRIDRKTVTPPLKGVPHLKHRQKKAVRKFYSPYVRWMTDRYHRIYTCRSGGRFSPAYIPEELYATWIDRYFCDREAARFLDNKCYYYRLFSNVKQPELVGMRIGAGWLDKDLKLVSFAHIQELVAAEPEVVVKRAVNSEGGAGVTFLEGSHLSAKFERLVKQIPCDLVVQKPLRQHPDMAKLHPESVNTLRIVSLLTGEHVKIYAVCVKIGVGKERLDNACHGGIYCGVRPDGRLKRNGSLGDGRQLVTRHPELLYRLEEQKIPHLSNALKLVKEAHAFMGHFRLISWDVAIDETGDAVLVETNLTLGGINNVQICNGPLFGKDTKKILDEVFSGRRRKYTTLI